VNIIDVEQDEHIMSILPLTKEAKYLILATEAGVVKKTKVEDFVNMRSSGLIAIRLKDSDALVSVRPTSGNDHIFLLSQQGKAIRFPEKNVRSMGRATSGVRGINLNKGDLVIAMEVFKGEKPRPKDKRRKFFRDILSISENGLGKRTGIDLFPVQRRAGKGVKAGVVNSKTGSLVAGILVNHEVEQIVVTSKGGQIIKLPLKNIPQMGRATQGVIIMRFANKRDKVAAATSLFKSENEEDSENKKRPTKRKATGRKPTKKKIAKKAPRKKPAPKKTAKRKTTKRK